MARIRRAWSAVHRWSHWRTLLIVAALVAVATGLGVGGSVVFVNWPDIGESDWGDRLVTARDVGIVAVGIFALILAGWRGWAADRQAAAAQDQVDTAQQGLLNDRYQKGAEMLDSTRLSVRLGGIYALRHVSIEAPEQFHLDIARLLCAFARDSASAIADKALAAPSDEDQGVDADQAVSLAVPHQDVQDAVWAIADRGLAQRELEREDARFVVDLRGMRLHSAELVDLDLSEALLQRANLTNANLLRANLANANLEEAVFRGVDLQGAILTNANLYDAILAAAFLPDAVMCGVRAQHADLSSAVLRGANLSGANLWRANLSGAQLHGAILQDADLSGASFSGIDGERAAEGLTQTQLDRACADLDNPPRLRGVIDRETQRPLVWHEHKCDDRA